MIKNTDRVIKFRKVKGPAGWMSNFSPHPLVDEFGDWPTAEHYFQAQRLSLLGPRQLIQGCSSPGLAKASYQACISKGVPYAHQPCSIEDVQVMVKTVFLKLYNNPDLYDKLLAIPRGARFVEDVTNRRDGNSLFWGAALIHEYWIGANVLGNIWTDYKNLLHEHGKKWGLVQRLVFENQLTDLT